MPKRTDREQAKRPHRLVSLLQAAIFVQVLAMLVAAFASLHPLADLATHFAFQHLIASSFFTLIMLLARQWRWSVLCAVMLVASAARVVPWWIPSGSQRAVASQPLRVFHLNVLSDNPRHLDVVSQIRTTDPDVIVLQEVNDDWMTSLTVIANEYPHRLAIPRSDNFGIALFSRHRFESSTTELLGDERLPSLEVTIDLDGTAVSILATHPVPPIPTDAARSRNDQLDAVAAHLEGRTRPTILVGDLNATMWSVPYKALVERTGLVNTRTGNGLLPTWPTRLPSFCRIPIDHCLVSPMIEIRRMELGTGIGSDHLPIIVDLGIPTSIGVD